MTFSKAMKADCIIWYAETKSPTKVKRMFRAKYGKNMVAPQDGSIKAWHAWFKGTGKPLEPLVSLALSSLKETLVRTNILNCWRKNFFQLSALWEMLLISSSCKTALHLTGHCEFESG